MITKKDFVCKHCGECCKRFVVLLTKKEVQTIEKMGYDKRTFCVPDDFDPEFGQFALTKKGDSCIFLKEKKGEYSCSIYDNRPQVCRDYPFIGIDKIETCKPKKSIFSQDH